MTSLIIMTTHTNILPDLHEELASHFGFGRLNNFILCLHHPKQFFQTTLLDLYLVGRLHSSLPILHHKNNNNT